MTNRRYDPQGPVQQVYSTDSSSVLTNGATSPLQCDNRGNLFATDGRPPRGPLSGSITVLPVSTTSTHWALSSASLAVVQSAVNSQYVTMRADSTNVYYAWSTAASSGSISATATVGSNPALQCQVLSAGERVDEIPPSGSLGLLVLGAGAGYLRVHVSG